MRYKLGWLICLMALGGGCVAIHPYGGNVIKGKPIFKGETTRTLEISDIQLVLLRQDKSSAKLSLVSSGRFDVQTDWERTDSPDTCLSIAIGLFPAYWAEVDRGEGGNYLAAMKVPLLSPLWNVCFFLAPTFYTMFCEPFSGDWNHHDDIWSLGLIGCWKYHGRSTWLESFEHQWRESAVVSQYEVGGLVVVVNGVRYESLAGQRHIVVAVPPTAAMAKVRVERVPPLGGELGRYLDSLVGKDFEVTIYGQ